jgi:hypothetical protein
MSSRTSASLGALTLMGATVLAFGACERAGGTAMTLESPHKTYVVDVSGRLSAPTIPVIEHRVRMTVRRGARQIVYGHEVDFADWFDDGFRGQYGRSEWVLENAVRFVSTSPSKARPDIIRVENRSGRPLPFLKVICRDLFLLFDLPPGSVTSLDATPQRAGSVVQSWVDVDGEWTGGVQLPGRGRNFDIEPGSRAYEYLVTITDNGVALAQRPRQ